ncbi:putative ubiquitin-conjugating enzyme E2 variant 1D-like [Capsicum annuum]|nr:putative ubiquitin-conjugating enzyme E2 variant 1D-like [Capsicum annuum]KAF3662611.1 putative ubiquitin-conjugating enzyme E2 variant 1D-like [Capsicum annuum]
MSRRNGNGLRLDLKLNLSPPPRVNHAAPVDSPTRSLTMSPTNSCVSSDDSLAGQHCSNSSEETGSMLLVGCPRCLMYVMLAEENDKRCPKCKSTRLLDVIYEKNKKRY